MQLQLAHDSDKLCGKTLPGSADAQLHPCAGAADAHLAELFDAPRQFAVGEPFEEIEIAAHPEAVPEHERTREEVRRHDLSIARAGVTVQRSSASLPGCPRQFPSSCVRSAGSLAGHIAGLTPVSGTKILRAMPHPAGYSVGSVKKATVAGPARTAAGCGGNSLPPAVVRIGAFNPLRPPQGGKEDFL